MNKLIELYNKIPKYIKRSFLRFFLSFFLAWVITVLFNDFPRFSKIITSSNIDYHLQNIIVWLTAKMLNLFGFEIWTNDNTVRIIGQPGIRYVYSCLGIRHIMLFSLFILFYFGKIIHKLWYIPVGIAVITLVNAFRGTVISLAQYIDNDATMLVHDISTPILMYSTIFILWITWVNKHLKTKQ